MIQWSLQQRGIVPVNSIIQINMIDETTKFNRAEGYYKRIALVGNTGGVFKQLVAFNKLREWCS